MKTSIEVVNAKIRAVNDVEGLPALLYQIVLSHHLTIREFARIFRISKDYAADIVHHRVFPPVDLAVRISRYFGCTTDELFAWRVDDDGSRRPLLVVPPWTRKSIRLKVDQDAHTAINLALAALEKKREGGK